MNDLLPSLPLLGLLSLGDTLALVFSALVFMVVIGVPLMVLGWGSYWLLALPLQREERARFFLHLLECCLRQGRPLEPSFIEMASVRDRSPGVAFHLFAAYLEEGDRFAEALRKVPSLLPAPVSALLQAGLEAGDVRAVLPVCRMQLRDARSGLRGMLNYFLVFAVGLAPMAVLVINMIAVYVLPRFKEIAVSMLEGAQLPLLTRIIFDSFHLGIYAEAGLFLVVLVVLITYAAGPALSRRLPWADWFAWHVPWKRHRMRRNFAAALALLLDHGMPEARSLQLAADCTANGVFRRRAARAHAELERGLPLAQAVHTLDPAGEFRWRLGNAAHGRETFTRTLRGWLEALDARAFQQEQSAAHVLSTGMVVFNGIIVGCVCAGVFGLLTFLIERGTLW
jgi:type II secretory pathway component PulF